MGEGAVPPDPPQLPADDARAVPHYSASCDPSDYGACAALADIYDSGPAAVRNDARAAELYSIVCFNGYPDACERAARYYRSGRGVKRDLKRAAELESQGKAR